MQDDCIAVALGLPQLKIVWQQESEGHIEDTQCLHVFVRRLRAKLEPDPANPGIMTVPGVGYQFKDTA